MEHELREKVENAIAAATGAAFRIERVRAVSGGCIHRAYAVESRLERYFIKTNNAGLADAFAAEADGLAALIDAGIRAPQPVCQGSEGTHAWLVLEFLDLGGAGDYALLGEHLARLHSVRAEAYGWHRDNYIGATLQRNGSADSWSEFWLTERLLPQLELAGRNGLGKSLVASGEKLAPALPALLAGRTPVPALLHGDLWGGNAAFLQDGTPVLFDPAVYRGDPETDVAMTELFGGFPASFYRAYRTVAPLDPGHGIRKTLYNLYHILNHANLFGGGYAGQAERMIAQLLAETR